MDNKYMIKTIITGECIVIGVNYKDILCLRQLAEESPTIGLIFESKDIQFTLFNTNEDDIESNHKTYEAYISCSKSLLYHIGKWSVNGIESLGNAIKEFSYRAANIPESEEHKKLMNFAYSIRYQEYMNDDTENESRD